jgi:hypothetical protein
VLKEKNMISPSCEEMLNKTTSGVPLELFKRMKSTSGKGSKYSPELKAFAMAYKFVRKTFNLALPHESQIRKWYPKIPANPGFTEAAFNALRPKVNDALQKKQKVVCSLMLDEMAIRKHISWDRKRFRGYVDLGNGSKEDDKEPVAKDALVLMAVCVNILFTEMFVENSMRLFLC